MDLKKKIKDHLSLTRKANDGFTLVELIVVIAILGILAGVGTVGYSGYITKANQAADQTLASDIKNALLLAHYAGDLKPGASVVVYYDDKDVKVNDESTAAAMKAAFGEDYAKSLRLSYGDWDLGVAANSEIISYVDGSAFSTTKSGNVAALLDNVQYLTDELSAVTSTGVLTINADSDLGKYLTNNGIALTDYIAASNGTTLYVADKISNTTSLDSDDELKLFTDAWRSMDASYFQRDDLYGSTEQYASTAAHYAQVLALATYIDTQTKDTANPTSYVSQLNGDSGVSGTAIKANIDTVMNGIKNNHSSVAGEYMGGEQAKTDAMAFLAYMNGITSSTDSLLTKTDLSNEKYYNDGSLLNYVTNYMGAANALTGADAEKGAFVFYYNAEAQTVACLPLEY